MSYAIFFGQCYDSYQCSENQLNRSINLVRGETKNFHRIHDFEDKVQLVLNLILKNISPEKINQIVSSLAVTLDPFPSTLFKTLMFSYRHNLDEEMVDLCLFMRSIAIRSTGSIYDLGGKPKSFCLRLKNWVYGDQKGTFLCFARVLRNEAKHQQINGLCIGFYLLEYAHSMDLFAAFVTLLVEKTIGLKTLVPQTLKRFEFKSRLDLIGSICISSYIGELLLKNDYLLDEYLHTIQITLDSCRKPEHKTVFLKNFKKTLDLKVNLGVWLKSLPLKIDSTAEFSQTSSPKNLMQLEFAEVMPFLKQYSIALFGNIPLSISPSEVPYTDGARVYLPSVEKKFFDSKKDLYNNRNATSYVANLFHEIGFHILAGSFLVNTQPTLKQFPNKDLAHLIFNVAEDYRGREHFLSQSYNSNWKQLLNEDEAMLTKSLPVPADWKNYFLQLFVSKGCDGKTPGDYDLEKKKQDLERHYLSFTIL